MNILFFTVSDKRSRDIESQAIAFAADGHHIFLLTQSARSELHEFFEARGFKAFGSRAFRGLFPLYMLSEIAKLAWFCFKHRIDVVHAHLDPCCLVAVHAQPFIRSRVIVTRHYADALRYETSERNQRISRSIYERARTVVAVSQNVKTFMVNEEQIDAGKISVIPLSYDFSLYALPSPAVVDALRKKYKARWLFCTVGRMTSLKRIDKIIMLIQQLLERGVDCELMVVGRGTEEMSLRNLVSVLNLNDRVHFEGFSHDVLSYLAAAHYYIHFSITEASCTAVKEAAWVHTPVIVCQGVGDFEQYIRHGENGYLVSRTDPVPDAVSLITKLLGDEDRRRDVGKALHNTVLSVFSIERAVPLYRALHEKVTSAEA